MIIDHIRNLDEFIKLYNSVDNSNLPTIDEILNLKDCVFCFYNKNTSRLEGVIYIENIDGKIFLSGFSIKKHYLKNVLAVKTVSEYLNPNYNTDAFKQSDSYYKNKMYNTLQNDYLNTAVSNNLMRGSTATDTMRGFAKDLANTEYERQQDYKNQQLQKLQAALLGYNTIYDMSKGVTGLSNALAQSVSNYNLNKYQQERNSNSSLC